VAGTGGHIVKAAPHATMGGVFVSLEPNRRIDEALVWSNYRSLRRCPANPAFFIKQDVSR
jgi:hypothetical protein